MTVYPIRSPRASIAGFTPQAAPASTSAAPASGVQLSVADGPRPPSMRAVDKRAAKRLAILQGRADSGLDVWPQTQRLVDAAQDARGDLSLYRSKYGDAASEAETTRLQREIERAEMALKEHRASTAALNAAGQSWRATYAAVAKAINAATAGGRALADAPADVPADADRHALTERAGEIAVQAQEAEQAPPPPELAKSQVRDRIERSAAHGAPLASVDEELSGPHANAKLRKVVNLTFAQKVVQAQPLGDDLPTVTDVEAVLCWAFREQILAKAEEDLENAYRDYAGPCYAPDERRARLAELADEKLQIERQLAEMIWRDIEAGDTSATFPAGMSPLAILGVREVRRPA